MAMLDVAVPLYLLVFCAINGQQATSNNFEACAQPGFRKSLSTTVLDRAVDPFLHVIPKSWHRNRDLSSDYIGRAASPSPFRQAPQHDSTTRVVRQLSYTHVSSFAWPSATLRRIPSARVRPVCLNLRAPPPFARWGKAPLDTLRLLFKQTATPAHPSIKMTAVDNGAGPRPLIVILCASPDAASLSLPSRHPSGIVIESVTLYSHLRAPETCMRRMRPSRPKDVRNVRTNVNYKAAPRCPNSDVKPSIARSHAPSGWRGVGDRLYSHHVATIPAQLYARSPSPQTVTLPSMRRRSASMEAQVDYSLTSLPLCPSSCFSGFSRAYKRCLASGSLRHGAIDGIARYSMIALLLTAALDSLHTIRSPFPLPYHCPSTRSADEQLAPGYGCLHTSSITQALGGRPSLARRSLPLTAGAPAGCHKSEVNMRGMHARGQAGHVVAVIASGEAWNALDGSAHEKVDAWQGSGISQSTQHDVDEGKGITTSAGLAPGIRFSFEATSTCLSCILTTTFSPSPHYYICGSTPRVESYHRFGATAVAPACIARALRALSLPSTPRKPASRTTSTSCCQCPSQNNHYSAPLAVDIFAAR
ncbi:hypothetical protein PYCCODRAFT_1426234 [Trametes coccinea BRFM310]|uniref:Uncharacterized protein n=1 Tax=Trametes coccinea (strain BRFM310) TaxID=1353009 RepID=A0A1Y2IKE8_TRAC3|nr:hypothetical protein PYCCODRAFT_1426234 [Trametes coccinea BRFM310]